MMSSITTWKLKTTENNHYDLQTVHLQGEPETLNAASRFISEGVYTTFRTFEGDRVVALGDHLHRLEESAQLLNRPISLNNEALRKALREVLRRFPAPDARVRISIDLEQEPGTPYILLEPLHVPADEKYRRGVAVVTVPMYRENPHAKQTSFIRLAEAVRKKLPPNVEEGLLLDEDKHILEGMSSNFFAVLYGELWTAEEGVLPGITRSLVLETARQAAIPVRLESISVSDVPRLSEAFITSSSRSILPVRQIDEVVVGNGWPGPVTRHLAEAYEREIRSRLEQI